MRDIVFTKNTASRTFLEDGTHFVVYTRNSTIENHSGYQQ